MHSSAPSKQCCACAIKTVRSGLGRRDGARLFSRSQTDSVDGELPVFNRSVHRVLTAIDVLGGTQVSYAGGLYGPKSRGNKG